MVTDWTRILVSEAIKPTETEFGTDYENGKFHKLMGENYITLFEHNGMFYSFGYMMGNVGFGKFDEKISLSDILSDPVKANEVVKQGVDNSSFNSIEIFNKVFFILKKLVETHGIYVLGFGGKDKLAKFYDRLVRNNALGKLVGEYGFEYAGTEIIQDKDGDDIKWHKFLKKK